MRLASGASSRSRRPRWMHRARARRVAEIVFSRRMQLKHERQAEPSQPQDAVRNLAFGGDRRLHRIGEQAHAACPHISTDARLDSGPVRGLGDGGSVCEATRLRVESDQAQAGVLTSPGWRASLAASLLIGGPHAAFGR